MTSRLPSRPNFSTIGIHADSDLNDSSSLTPPIYQTSTHVGATAEAFAEMATEPRHPRLYARYGNPNHAQVQRIIADLEGAENALLLGLRNGSYVHDRDSAGGGGRSREFIERALRRR